MKNAAVALRALIVNEIGLEGFLLVLGIGLLAYASTAIGWFGPYAVVGAALTLLGIALALPGRPEPVSRTATINDSLGIANPPEAR